jgi:predicted Zn finger-like uncharacterized protein
MRIDCPSCHVVYQVPAEVARGRKVRCARCREEFVADPLGVDEPAAEPDNAVKQIPLIPLGASWPPDPGPPRRRASDFPPTADGSTSAGRSPSRIRTPMALALSVLVLVGLGYVAYLFRDEAMTVWPPSQRLFQILGAA